MSQKRTGRFQGESGSTDYKTRPLDAEDAVMDDRRFSESRESLFANSQPIPPDVPEPETEAAREEELARQARNREGQRKRARAKGKKR